MHKGGNPKANSPIGVWGKFINNGIDVKYHGQVMSESVYKEL